MSEHNKKEATIAVFDFDGTITTKDTLFDFIEFYYSKSKLIQGLLILSPVLVLFKLGIISNESAKKKMFSHFFRNQQESEFRAKCQAYVTRINEIIRPEAINKIKWHQSEGHNVLIISASVADWIKPWASMHGIEEVMGTGMEATGGRITGSFATPNCHGKEKVNRLLAKYPDRSDYELYMYGDSSGDTAMLELADYPFYRKF